jgi:hypothetical protein
MYYVHLHPYGEFGSVGQGHKRVDHLSLDLQMTVRPHAFCQKGSQHHAKQAQNYSENKTCGYHSSNLSSRSHLYLEA